MRDASLPIAGTVLLEERNVYGNTLLYPANRLAEILLALTGAKTFTPMAVLHIKQLGLRVMTTGAQPREL